MARIRTIKPEFFSDERLSECSLSAHVLFMGLIVFADDAGRMPWSPARIRMQVFPSGAVPLPKLMELLGELIESSLIRVYGADSEWFLEVCNFLKHQRINRPTPSRIPAYSVSTHGVLSASSLTERKGKGTGKGKEPPKPLPLAPDGVNAAAFQEWIDYRIKIGKPVKEISYPALWSKMLEHGNQVAQARAVKHSIANGWQGLFQETVNGAPAKVHVPRKTTEQLLAEGHRE